MKILVRYFIIFFVIFNFSFLPVFAEKGVKSIVNIHQEFNLNNISDEVYFIVPKNIELNDNTIIPEGSILISETINAQSERRWHKSGYILCKLTGYLPSINESLVDLSDKNLYFIVRKYEPINKKEAAILATEIILTQGASFFAPGVDVLYFFTKGAILRKKHPHWFKAGVYNAYENSIFWFWLKGKPIDIDANQMVSIKQIEEDKVFKLNSQIDKRNEKLHAKNLKKQAKLAKKAEKLKLKQADYDYFENLNDNIIYIYFLQDVPDFEYDFGEVL
jgi:hypothetical protein